MIDGLVLARDVISDLSSADTLIGKTIAAVVNIEVTEKSTLQVMKNCIEEKFELFLMQLLKKEYTQRKWQGIYKRETLAPEKYKPSVYDSHKLLSMMNLKNFKVIISFNF